MIIGIHGYSGSGKDTVGKMIAEYAPSQQWQIKKFAGKLKDVASMLTGIPVEKFEDQEFKKTNLGKEWSYQVDQFNTPTQMTVRELLQKLGTEAMREGLHTNTWVNALMADYTPSSNWLVTDCRFPNEADAIKKAGGLVIHVERTGVGPINDHPSETGLDGYPYDYFILNHGDMNYLRNEVGMLMRAINAEDAAKAKEDLLVDNMCLSYRHDFGLMSPQDKQDLRIQCREWLRAYRNNIGL